MIVEVYNLCGKYSCSCIIILHHVHSCHEHMHQARSVRKLYDYLRVLLWIMSLTMVTTIPVQHRTLPEEG
jgi:hypothetical protein